MATSDIQIAEHALQHHFADMEQQRETSTFGMWMFLLTEIMFFGGLFCAYLVYRASYYQAFVEGSQKMNIWLGATNTAVLICSSLTMALAVRRAQTGQAQADGRPAGHHHHFRLRISRHQGNRVPRALGEPRVSRTELPLPDRRSSHPATDPSTPRFTSRSTGR